jgi:hypothetical protein
MSRRSTIRALALLAVSATGAWALAACSNGSSAPAGGSSENTDDGGPSSSDTPGSSSGSSGSASGSGSGSSSGSTSGGTSSGAKSDAGSGKDGGATVDGSADGGARDIGSCCTTQTTPGCNDPNLELCVCQKDSDCCTKAWTTACTLIVEEKYCQPGIRDCVCGTDVDAGQWGQTDCCDADWSSTCDSVATLKCGAAQGCF